jgi:DNA-binding MarR family transcriptional regulator
MSGNSFNISDNLSKNLFAKNNCIVTRIRITTRELTNFYESEFKNSNLSVAQFSLLNEIIINEPVKYSKLVYLLHLKRNTLSRNIDVLKEKNFINNVMLSKNRKEKSLVATKEGKKEWIDTYPFWEKLQNLIMDNYGFYRMQVFLKELDYLAQTVINIKK